MVDVKIKVRMGRDLLYDSQVCVGLDESVRSLKQKICDNHSDLNITLIETVYCGCVMEDCDSVGSYEVFKGATVYVFKKLKIDKPTPPKTLKEADLVKLGIAFRSLSLNSSYRVALMKLSNPEVINNIILTTPGLNQDPVALTLLQHSEILVKLSDFEIVKRISEAHPALAEAALQIAAVAHEDFLQNHQSSNDLLSNSLIVPDEDEYPNSPPPESSSQLLSRNSSFAAITAAQLRLAIANATSQQSLPSTSGASTSTGSTNTRSLNSGPSNDLVGNLTINPTNTEVQSPRPANADLRANLQIMRDMGLTNETLNRQALILCSDLETAIELVLTGFSASPS